LFREKKFSISYPFLSLLFRYLCRNQFSGQLSDKFSNFIQLDMRFNFFSCPLPPHCSWNYGDSSCEPCYNVTALQKDLTLPYDQSTHHTHLLSSYTSQFNWSTQDPNHSLTLRSTKSSSFYELPEGLESSTWVEKRTHFLGQKQLFYEYQFKFAFSFLFHFISFPFHFFFISFLFHFISFSFHFFFISFLFHFISFSFHFFFISFLFHFLLFLVQYFPFT
jgi:hypothetical protein